MKQIPLTQGKVAFVDDSDYEILSRWSWSAHREIYTYYAVRNIQMPNSKKQTIRMHRVILSAPDGVEIDHVNRNGLDNRRSNLRLCNHTENLMNQRLRSDNETRLKGVGIEKRNINKRFRARIMINRKRVYIGSYQIAEDAARAYDRAALEYYGEFAMTNEKLKLY